MLSLPAMEQQQRLARKRELKAAFDSEYDEEGGGGYLEGLRHKASEQTQLNQAEFSGVDEQARLQYQGLPPGSYVRLEVEGEVTHSLLY